MKLYPFQEDLSSEEKLYNVEEEIYLETNPEALANSVVLDGKTGEISTKGFNPNAIKKIIIHLGNNTINLQELMKLTQ